MKEIQIFTAAAICLPLIKPVVSPITGRFKLFIHHLQGTCESQCISRLESIKRSSFSIFIMVKTPSIVLNVHPNMREYFKYPGKRKNTKYESSRRRQSLKSGSIRHAHSPPSQPARTPSSQRAPDPKHHTPRHRDTTHSGIQWNNLVEHTQCFFTFSKQFLYI